MKRPMAMGLNKAFSNLDKLLNKNKDHTAVLFLSLMILVALIDLSHVLIVIEKAYEYLMNIKTSILSTFLIAYQ